MNIGSGNGLVTLGKNTLAEPMITKFYDELLFYWAAAINDIEPYAVFKIAVQLPFPLFLGWTLIMLDRRLFSWFFEPMIIQFTNTHIRKTFHCDRNSVKVNIDKHIQYNQNRSKFRYWDGRQFTVVMMLEYYRVPFNIVIMERYIYMKAPCDNMS